MVRPNYRDYKRSQFIIGSDRHLEHSAKGSTWEEHKYIKRINGTYYYPDSYEGGRHLPEGEKENNNDIISKLEDMSGMKREALVELQTLGKEKGYDSKEYLEALSVLSEGDDDQAKKITDLLKGENSKIDLSVNDIENLAKEVIRGNFGNGQERKDLLGENYAEIQKRVNELMKGSTGSKKVTEATNESIKKAEDAAKNVTETSTKESKVHSGVDMDQVQSVYRKKKNK